MKDLSNCHTGLLNIYGDGFCDDVTNTPECNYDGGDCCGDNVKEDFCFNCICLDPTFPTSL